jgi:hypothetical protein
MTLAGYEVFAIIGFLFAAYAVIANDSIQTLGTFLASNSHRPWWVLWLFAAGIMVAALLFQLFYGGGDIADGKLNKLPYPEGGIKWWHALPPLVLLFLTRFGIPVSTTFLVLTVFALSGGAATDGVMTKMLIKSLTGYVVAFATGALSWLAISRTTAPDLDTVPVVNNRFSLVDLAAAGLCQYLRIPATYASLRRRWRGHGDDICTSIHHIRHGRDGPDDGIYFQITRWRYPENRSV